MNTANLFAAANEAAMVVYGSEAVRIRIKTRSGSCLDLDVPVTGQPMQSVQGAVSEGLVVDCPACFASVVTVIRMNRKRMSRGAICDAMEKQNWNFDEETISTAIRQTMECGLVRYEEEDEEPGYNIASKRGGRPGRYKRHPTETTAEETAKLLK